MLIRLGEIQICLLGERKQREGSRRCGNCGRGPVNPQRQSGRCAGGRPPLRGDTVREKVAGRRLQTHGEVLSHHLGSLPVLQSPLGGNPHPPSAVVRSAQARLSPGALEAGPRLCGEGFSSAPCPPSVEVKKGGQGVARGGVTPKGVVTWRTLTGEWLESKNVRPDAETKADGVARQEEMEAPRAQGSQQNRRKCIKRGNLQQHEFRALGLGT